MRYTFTLDRGSMIQASVGLILVFLLVFAAGVVVGLRLQWPARLAASASDSSAVAATAVASLPTTDSVSASSSGDADGLASAPAADDSPSPAAPSADGTDSTAVSTLPTADAQDPWTPTASRSPGASTSIIAAPYTVQLGVFANPENAQALAQTVQTDGHSVAIRQRSQNGRTLHYVWAGAYESSQAAARAVGTFASYVPGAFMVRTPSEAAVAQVQ